MYIGVRATAGMDFDWGQGDVTVLFTLFILTDLMGMGGLFLLHFDILHIRSLAWHGEWRWCV